MNDGVSAAKNGSFSARARVLAAGAIAAILATCSKGALPDKSETALADVLGRAVGGHVEPSDVIWEPSGGFLRDAFVGRKVLFLARRDEASPRRLYRAAVTVTHGGRPLEVRAAVALTDTDLADASGLVATGERAAFATTTEGRTENVTVLDLAPEATSANRPSRWRRAFETAKEGDVGARVEAEALSFDRPPASAAYDFDGNDLVVSFASGGAVLDGHGSLAIAGDGATKIFTTPASTIAPRDDERWASPFRVWTRRVPIAPTIDPKAIAGLGALWAKAGDAAPASRFAFPPAGDFHALVGHDGVYRADRTVGDAAITLMAFDTRLLAPHLAAGATTPRTRTGHFAEGSIPVADRSTAVAAILLPSAASSGAWDRGVLVAPLDPALATLDMSEGALAVDETPGTAPRVGTALQWPRAQNAERRERSLGCATAAGHWIDAWSEAATPDELRQSVADLDCAVTLPAASSDMLGGAWLASEGGALHATPWNDANAARWTNVEGGLAAPVLYFVKTKTAPEMPAALTPTFAPSSAAEPEPTTIPATYEASIDRLGETVHIHLFMARRFDWAMRAGEQEKTHRFGGTFEKTLDETDKARAFFAFGVGVGKRKGPFGLRIAGSTGHAFRREGGVVEATPDGLRLTLADGEEPVGDATELPLTVEGRALTSEARVRGPKEERADLCVLDDGSVIVADEELDNHEGPASVLVDLGCALAVALDRGAERPAWLEDRSSTTLGDVHPTTAIYALGRPFEGSVRVVPSP